VFGNKKIKFHCLLPEVMEKYPIIKAKEYKPLWLRDSALAYKQDLQNNSKTNHVNGTVKCSGIQSILNRGFILRTWHDLTIKTGTDPHKFEYIIPEAISSYLHARNYDSPLISWFDGEDPRMRVPVPDGSLKTIIKLTMPWSVEIPKGWSLLIQPIPYPDETAFTATHGVLDQGNFFEINPILVWHKMQSETLIKAGTPICQLIPIKNEQMDFENLPYDDETKKRAMSWKYNICHRFVRNHL
jgi:hypothetical protein